jgi:hypothetical protein
MMGVSVGIAKMSTTPQRIVTDKDLHYYEQTSLASFTVARPGWSGWGMLFSGSLLLGGGYNLVKSMEQEDEQNSSPPSRTPRQQSRISTVVSEDENDDDLVIDRPEEDSKEDIEESLENGEEVADKDSNPRLPDASHPLYAEAKQLIDVLERLNLHSDFVEAIAGPSILEIVVQPQVIPDGRRVMVSNIEKASKDLQVKLSTKKPPVISTSAKGVQIQIPRNDRQIIPFETVNSSWELSNNPVDVELLLGCDISFNPVRTKFRDLPHWFILGESGGGKSVLLQCQVADLMMNYSPKVVQFVLSDLKGETFYQIPNDLPWLSQPVAINDPEASLGQIQWLIEESERRQKTFESAGVPSWEGYNELMIEQGQPVMPRLIYISDENSDLSEKGGKWTSKWEGLMPEFTRKCRSRGINVIVTQQRGTADQISRAVVSNLQGRICLSVVDEPNSTVCIGSSGGENLLGKGDLLAKTKFELIRLQSPYLNPKSKWFSSIPEEYKLGKKVEPKNEVVSTQIEEFEFKISQPQTPTFHPTKTDWNHIALDSSQEDLRELMRIIESRLKPVDSTPVEVDVEIVESTSTESTSLQVVEEQSTDVDSVSTLPSELSWNSVDASTFKIVYGDKYPEMSGEEIESFFWGEVKVAIAEGLMASQITREVLLCTSTRENSSRNYSRIGVPLLTYFLQNYGLKDPEIADKVRANFRNVR